MSPQCARRRCRHHRWSSCKVYTEEERTSGVFVSFNQSRCEMAIFGLFTVEMFRQVCDAFVIFILCKTSDTLTQRAFSLIGSPHRVARLSRINSIRAVSKMSLCAHLSLCVSPWSPNKVSLKATQNDFVRAMLLLLFLFLCASSYTFRAGDEGTWNAMSLIKFLIKNEKKNLLSFKTMEFDASSLHLRSSFDIKIHCVRQEVLSIAVELYDLCLTLNCFFSRALGRHIAVVSERWQFLVGDGLCTIPQYH